MTITRFHHVATVVPTLEAGAAVWRDIFGLDVEVEATVPEQGVRAALLPCGDGEIELLEALDPQNAIGRYLAKGGGIHHVCLESSDVAAELTRLAAAGVRLVDTVPRAGLAGQIGFLHPRSTHGTLVELATPGSGVPTQPFVDGHAPDGTPLRAKGVSHVTFVVADLEAAAGTFSANFGMSAAEGPEAAPEIGATVLRLRLPNASIELAQPAATDGWAARRLEERGQGAALLGLVVESLDPGITALRAKGIDVVEARAADGDEVAIVDPGACFGVAIALREVPSA